LDVSAAQDLLREIGELVETTRSETGVHRVPTTYGFAMWLWARAASTFDAAHLLLTTGYLDGALSLGRALFTDALRLLEIEDRAGDREALLLGWASSGITERDNLLTEAVNLGLETSPGEVRARIADERAALGGYQQRRGIARLRSFESEKVLARKFGLAEDYWSFRFTSQFVHGSPFTLPSRAVETPEGVVGFTARQDDPDLIVTTALFLGRFALFAMQAFRGVFGMPFSSRVPELVGVIEAEAIRRRDEGPP
jgi:hypothetical protein